MVLLALWLCRQKSVYRWTRWIVRPISREPRPLQYYRQVVPHPASRLGRLSVKRLEDPDKVRYLNIRNRLIADRGPDVPSEPRSPNALLVTPPTGLALLHYRFECGQQSRHLGRPLRRERIAARAHKPQILQSSIASSSEGHHREPAQPKSATPSADAQPLLPAFGTRRVNPQNEAELVTILPCRSNLLDKRRSQPPPVPRHVLTPYKLETEPIMRSPQQSCKLLFLFTYLGTRSGAPEDRESHLRCSVWGQYPPGEPLRYPLQVRRKRRGPHGYRRIVASHREA